MKRFALPFLVATTLSGADTPIAPAMNAFTTATYRELARGSGNLILSPFNIGTALSMALAGAGGTTAEEIERVLHSRYDPDYDAALGALLAALSNAGNSAGNELLTANGLWVQQGFAILPSFRGRLANAYGAPLTPRDFVSNAEAARARINRWTEERTKGRIRNLFPVGTLDARTRVVLTSAIYFHGKWQLPFESSRTLPAAFHLSGASTAQTNFMNQTGDFKFTETPEAQVLEMAYAGTGMAFDVLLPKSTNGLPGLESALSVEDLKGWLGSLATRQVQVSLPKFRVESQFSLRDTLSAMGMPRAFTGEADFSGIGPGRGLTISDVLHKAYVDVAEEGTEAAAATGIAMMSIAMRMPPKAVVFRADHPFLFAIRDTRTGVVLFIGRVLDPR